MFGYHFPAVVIRCKRAPAVRTIVHCHANACDIGSVYELCQRWGMADIARHVIGMHPTQETRVQNRVDSFETSRNAGTNRDHTRTR